MSSVAPDFNFHRLVHPSASDDLSLSKAAFHAYLRNYAQKKASPRIHVATMNDRPACNGESSPSTDQNRLLMMETNAEKFGL
ncbi:hypothetical protein EW026_g6570 [Hermanssonia centrifuga]|uniref:Uncharacterized protein n=1 Tax=Hermanssonia centrifuga TaxID=98765 RepID=A0A4S4KAJ3_9APHY|nr:hypothetical protein EW026_g6570 [Hermanssonia centrifuga]